MSTPTPERVRTAADLRAAGNAWERVGEVVGVSPAEVREWPTQFPAEWRRAFTAALRRTLAEATSEAVTVLRQLLRSTKPSVVCNAGLILVRIRVLLDPPRRKPATATQPPSPPGSADRLLALVRGMTDDELALAAATGGAQAPG